MTEDGRKHLEFIQQVITRMNSNSFQLKGWSVTLVAGLFALAVAEANKAFALLGVFPILVFWLLDAYYLQMERSYRALYNTLRVKSDYELTKLGDKIYCMNPKEFGIQDERLSKVCRRPAVAFFHGPLLLLAFIVILLVLAFSGKSRSSTGAPTTANPCACTSVTYDLCAPQLGRTIASNPRKTFGFDNLPLRTITEAGGVFGKPATYKSGMAIPAIASNGMFKVTRGPCYFAGVGPR
jgi:hypothetical protein